PARWLDKAVTPQDSSTQVCRDQGAGGRRQGRAEGYSEAVRFPEGVEATPQALRQRRRAGVEGEAGEGPRGRGGPRRPGGGGGVAPAASLQTPLCRRLVADALDDARGLAHGRGEAVPPTSPPPS